MTVSVAQIVGLGGAFVDQPGGHHRPRQKRHRPGHRRRTARLDPLELDWEYSAVEDEDDDWDDDDDW